MIEERRQATSDWGKRHTIEMSEAAAAALITAMEIDFGIPVTAYISNASVLAGKCVGTVHGHLDADESGRNADGTLFGTDLITNATQAEGYWIIAAGEPVYVLASFREPDGLASFENMLKDFTRNEI